MNLAKINIRNPLIRTFHWVLVSMVAIAWVTGDDAGLVHDWTGYIALALIALRIVWHFVGPRQASMTRYLRGSGRMFGYLADLVKGRKPKVIGPYPAIGLSVIVLVVTIIGTGVTGWMLREPVNLAMMQELPSVVAPAYADGSEYRGYGYGDDDEHDGFGGEAVEEIHEFLANLLLLTIFVHVSLMVYVATQGSTPKPESRAGKPSTEGRSTE